jgi:hypothetical protein
MEGPQYVITYCEPPARNRGSFEYRFIGEAVSIIENTLTETFSTNPTFKIPRTTRKPLSNHVAKEKRNSHEA